MKRAARVVCRGGARTAREVSLGQVDFQPKRRKVRKPFGARETEAERGEGKRMSPLGPFGKISEAERKPRGRKNGPGNRAFTPMP